MIRAAAPFPDYEKTAAAPFPDFEKTAAAPYPDYEKTAVQPLMNLEKTAVQQLLISFVKQESSAYAAARSLMEVIVPLGSSAEIALAYHWK